MAQRTGPHGVHAPRNCRHCKGKGRILCKDVEKPCPVCGGSGKSHTLKRTK